MLLMEWGQAITFFLQKHKTYKKTYETFLTIFPRYQKNSQAAQSEDFVENCMIVVLRIVQVTIAFLHQVLSCCQSKSDQ